MKNENFVPAFSYIYDYVCEQWDVFPWCSLLSPEQIAIAAFVIYAFQSRDAVAFDCFSGEHKCSFIASTNRIVCILDNQRSWAKSDSPLNIETDIEIDVDNILMLMAVAYTRAASR